MQVAVLWSQGITDDDFYTTISRYITDWAEITEEEYWTLVKWSNRQRNIQYGLVPHVIRKLDHDEIKKSVEECIILAKQHEEKERLEKEKRARKKQEKEYNKQKVKEALFEKLKAELGK
jgi:hypothetical protein